MIDRICCLWWEVCHAAVITCKQWATGHWTGDRIVKYSDVGRCLQIKFGRWWSWVDKSLSEQDKGGLQRPFILFLFATCQWSAWCSSVVPWPVSLMSQYSDHHPSLQTRLTSPLMCHSSLSLSPLHSETWCGHCKNQILYWRPMIWTGNNQV